MAAKKNVFYSFHYDNDVFRVQQIRNMGIIEGNPSISANAWETVKKGGDRAIEKCIDVNMKRQECVLVLVGEETYKRPWVKYEIKKVWTDRKGLFGIYIYNLKDPKTGMCSKGTNPFDQFTFKDGSKLSSVINCYNPDSADAYNDIDNNIVAWIEKAIKDRK